MLPPSLSTSDKQYKAILVLARKTYHTKWITGDIPEFINYGAKTLKLRMVLWDCQRRDESRLTFLKLKVLVYK